STRWRARPYRALNSPSEFFCVWEVKPIETAMELQTPPRARTDIRWAEEVVIPASPKYVSMVRKRVVQLVADVGFSVDAADEIAVAVSEAVSNAIEHAQPDGDA